MEEQEDPGASFKGTFSPPPSLSLPPSLLPRLAGIQTGSPLISKQLRVLLNLTASACVCVTESSGPNGEHARARARARVCVLPLG